MKIYIASPFFNEVQLNDVDDIKAILYELGLNFFSPKDENLANPDDDGDVLLSVFSRNIKEILVCDLMIANTRDKDMGTLFEAGYAYATHVPVIYYCNGLKGNFNLMLAQSAVAVATNKTELFTYISRFLQDKNYSNKYSGRIE